MTTPSEYDELVKRLGRLADIIDNGGAVDFPDWASVREASDAITRLTREVASARAAGVEEMRESAIAIVNEARQNPMDLRSIIHRIKALPLPSVAVQAVPTDDAAESTAGMINASPTPSPNK